MLLDDTPLQSPGRFSGEKITWSSLQQSVKSGDISSPCHVPKIEPAGKKLSKRDAHSSAINAFNATASAHGDVSFVLTTAHGPGCSLRNESTRVSFSDMTSRGSSLLRLPSSRMISGGPS